MAITKVIIADVSTLTVGGTLVEAATNFQLSRNAETRPINCFNSVLPVLIISSKGPGNGSFSYVASDGTGSAGGTDWSATLNGAAVITCSGASYPSGTTTTHTCSGCTFSGQSMGMGAKSEMTMSVNFLYTSGTW